MITKRKEIQSEIVFMEMNEMVPKESIFRKIDKYIDFTFIYEEVKELFKKRKTTVERSFWDSKQNHGYRYTLFKGVEKNQAYTHLICAARNMKNIVIKRTNIDKKKENNMLNTDIFKKTSKFIQKIAKRKPHIFNMWGLSTI